MNATRSTHDSFDRRVGVRALLLGTLFSGVFTGLSVYFMHYRRLLTSATQIPVLPFALLAIGLLVVNPVLRRIKRPRPLTAAEMMIVFIMTFVSAGISVFGLSSQLVPVVANLFNPHHNTRQSEWDRTVVPDLNEAYFLAEPGIQAAAHAYREAFRDYEHAQREAGAGRRSEAELVAVRDRMRLTREALYGIQSRAFEKVSRFRRGLPATERAFPGILPTNLDSLDNYRARFRRMWFGHRALAAVSRARAHANDRGAVRRELNHSLDLLEKIGTHATMDAARQARIDQIHDWVAEQSRLASDLSETRQRLRFAERDEIARLEREGRAVQTRLRRQQARIQRTEKQVARLNHGVEMATRVADLIAGIRDLRDGVSERPMPVEHIDRKLAVLVEAFPAMDGTVRRYLLGDIPWYDWLGPLSRWLVIVALVYVLLLAYNVLIFRQWAHHEKLVYPIAELARQLGGADGAAPDGLIPPIYRRGSFWAGLAISGSIMGWNLVQATAVIPGLNPIQLGALWRPYIVDTPLAGLLFSARSTIFFTMIGLAFLIPQKISFSLWAFYLLYMAQLLVITGLGYGVNERSFPEDWIQTMNFKTAQGGGAMMVFSMVMLYKCRKYLLCVLRPAVLSGLAPDEQRELRWASFLFIGSSLGLILVLWLGMKASLLHTMGCLLVVLLLTTGLIRAVAEGGILGFQAYTGPFHLLRTLFGMNHSWSHPSLFAPLVVFYSVFFFDLKTFIAPAMASCLKLRDGLRLHRARFHLALFLGIAVAVLVGIVWEILLGYHIGSDNLSNWFHTAFPRTVFNQISAMAKNPPPVDPATRGWLLAGAAAMALLLYSRQFLFWLPHPIGMIMLVNPLMASYWFSLLLGWLAKSLVTKYGHKRTVQQSNRFFIGLIAGELFIVLLAMVFSVILNRNLEIDLNR